MRSVYGNAHPVYEPTSRHVSCNTSSRPSRLEPATSARLLFGFSCSRGEIAPVLLRSCSPVMPVSWRILRSVVFLESTGKPTFAEWRAAVDAFLADADYRPGMSVVHDWREAQDVHSPIEIQKRAAYTAGRLSSSHSTRWALVVRGVTSSGLRAGRPRRGRRSRARGRAP